MTPARPARLAAVLRSGLLPGVAVAAGAVLFRLPVLLNASGVNSDAAIVGLQAMHLLRGEHAVFVWGSGYQTSVDSYAAAALFALLGPSPVVLVLSALSLHVVLTLLAWGIVRRRVRSAWLAVALVLPLVMSTAAINSYALNPPRQAALTLGMAALALADRRRALASGLAALLAVYADPYALLLAPAAALLVGMARPRELRRFGAGAALGGVPLLLRLAHPAAQHGIHSMSLDVLSHNARLLFDPCGPWFLGTTVWTAHGPSWAPWQAPRVVRAFQLAGGAAFFAVVLGALVVAARRWRTRAARLAIAGATVMALTVLGFLVSRMVMDHFSMRYLAAVAVAVPLVATPLALRLGARRFLPLWAPYVATSAVCGWMTYTPYVRGILPVRDPVASGAPERELVARLAERGVGHAIADYWAAYRITFVTRERLVVVPLHEEQDRHRAYREELERAETFAYVFDPSRSSEDEEAANLRLATTFERIAAVRGGDLRAVVYRRVPRPGATARASEPR